MEKGAKKKSKFREIAAYLVCGVLTTVVNVAVYHVLYKVGLGVTTSGVISVVCAKIFAYISNKLFVFDSHCENKEELGKEIWRFILARGLSGVLDVALTMLFSVIIPKDFGFAKTLGGFSLSFVILEPGLAAKYITQPIVIVLNYVLGKWYVFKGKGAEEAEAEAAEAAAEPEEEMEDREDRPFHTFFILVLDFFQDQFARVYELLFSSKEGESEGESESEGITKESLMEKFFGILDFFRFFDFVDWVKGLFSRKKADNFYAYGSDSGEDGDVYQEKAGADTESEGSTARTGGFNFSPFAARGLSFLVALAIVFMFFKISRGLYKDFVMTQTHLFRQGHMLETLNQIFFNELGDRFGALFSALQSLYANFCSRLNYAKLLTTGQYSLLPCLAAGVCLIILTLAQNLIRMHAASTIFTLGLIFFLAGGNILQLDGGLFVLQMTLTLLILTSYRAAVSGYGGSYKYFLIRALLISLLAGLPGTAPVFAFICLILVTLTQFVGVIWNSRGKGFADFLLLAASRFLPLLLPVCALYFFCGGLDPLNYSVSGDFWIVSSPDPVAVSPYLARTGLLATLAVAFGAFLMFFSSLKRCGLFCILGSFFFYVYLRLTKLDPATAGYASSFLLTLVIGAGGILLGQLAVLAAKYLGRFLFAPRLRYLISALLALPFIIYVLTAKSSAFEAGTSDLSEITEKICQSLDDREGGFKKGDLIVLPSLFAGENKEAGASLYDVLRYENRRKAMRQWNFLENSDLSSLRDLDNQKDARVWWVIPAHTSGLGSVSDICDVKVVDDHATLLRSSVPLRSPQQLAAMTFAVLGCVDAAWVRDCANELARQLALLPPLPKYELLDVTTARGYRRGLFLGLKLSDAEELRKTHSLWGAFVCAVKAKRLDEAQRFFDLACAEEKDVRLLIQVYSAFGSGIRFLSPEDLMSRYGLAIENFRILCPLFDKFYHNDPANFPFSRPWQDLKKSFANGPDPSEEYSKRFTPDRRLCVTLTNELPREAFFEEKDEMLRDRYFEKGLGAWRIESVLGDRLPSTFISVPDLWLLAQGEPGGKAGVSQRLEVEKGVYLAGAYARVPEGREAPDEISLKFRGSGLEAVTRTAKWKSGSWQWTYCCLIVTNTVPGRANFFCGSENIASPGSVEFTDLTFRRIDGSGEEAWLSSPLRARLRRETDSVALRLEEREEQLKRENILRESPLLTPDASSDRIPGENTAETMQRERPDNSFER